MVTDRRAIVSLTFLLVNGATFPIVKRKDEKAYGHYRTKAQILEIYDAMKDAIKSNQPYQTLLDPPPADPRVAHPPR